MDEELEKLLSNTGNTEEATKNGQQVATVPAVPTTSTQPEVELTPEIKETTPVVNRARKQNRLSGITNFLNNPETQNALLQFGRAFAKNREGEAGTILADAGEDIIGGKADQRALEAFESGENISEAAGRFANPELVAGLQQRQVQQEQFDQELGVKEKQLELQELGIGYDAALGFARLGQDQGQFDKRYNLLKRSADLEDRIGDARIKLLEAQAGAVGDGTGFTESLALRTNEYIELLNEQESIIDEDINQVRDLLSDIDVQLNDAEIQGLVSGDITAEDLDLSDADASNWPGYAGSGPKQAKALVKQLGAAAKRKRNLLTQRETLQNVQTSRLTGGQGGQGGEEEGEAVEQFTPENPATPGSLSDANSLQPGSVFVNPLNPDQLLRLNEDGTKTPVKRN